MALFDDALDYLQITWEDPQLQRKLELGLQRGESLLNEYAGCELDFETPDTPQALLFDYLRYVRSDATEVFEHNFGQDLIRLRALYGTAGTVDDDAGG